MESTCPKHEPKSYYYSSVFMNCLFPVFLLLFSDNNDWRSGGSGRPAARLIVHDIETLPSADASAPYMEDLLPTFVLDI